MSRHPDIPDIPRRRLPREPPAPPPPTTLPPQPSVPLDPDKCCRLEEVGLQLVETEPVVVRARWGARDPRHPPEPRDGPPGRIFVVHTKTSQCKTFEECSMVLQELQETMMFENGEDDLPYNFIVGGDGRVYEGRGWKAKLYLPPSLPAYYEDGTNFIIGLIGDFSLRTQQRPPERMVKARREFVMYGKDLGHFDKKIGIYTDIQWKI